MANTPQAKKRIRRNANREIINHSRISRIRTFIKAVESAIDSGKKKEAAEALKKVQPEIARGVARGVIHKNTAARKFSRLSKRVASLGLKSIRNRIRFEPPGNRRLVPFLDRKKNVAIPAIRVAVNAPLTKRMALFRHFLKLSA